MDVTWIPGQADVVVGIVVIAIVGGALWWGVRRRGTAKRSGGALASTAPTGAGTSRVTVASGTSPATPEPGTSQTADQPEESAGRFARRRERLGGGLGTALAGFFGRRDLDRGAWEELEEALLMADVGAATTSQIIAQVQARVGDGQHSAREALREALLEALDPDADRSLAVGAPGDGDLAAVLVVGVNGVGKTTSVGKIARLLVADGHSVVLGAADTFRAAAADQLETWGARVGVATVRSHTDGADPASVAYEAAHTAEQDGADVVLIDTAGRLQNKSGLMDQLGKIHRVVSKVVQPREILLVIDATTGQNGLAQAQVFGQAVPLTGIVLTKMDGTAKGGIVLAVQRALGVPVKLVGLGEGADDLAPFDAHGFVDGLLG